MDASPDAFRPDNSAALILAAGKGERMKSSRPKALQTLLGSPMLAYVQAALEPIFHDRIFVVTGHGADQIEKAFPESKFVFQASQQGTGHALIIALPVLEGYENALIINGDAPLVTTELLENFLKQATGADLAFATVSLNDPGAYGRIVRNGDNSVKAIVEAKEFDPSTHGEASGEVNAGIYFIRLSAVKPLLARLNANNKAGEYYLTDLVELALLAQLDVRAIQCGADQALLGVNTPAELIQAEEEMRKDAIRKLLDSGVALHAPDSVRISPFASIASGVEICGPCEIYGKTHIRTGANIASHCVIEDSLINENAEIRSFSHIVNAIVGIDARVGPFARLRPGADLGADSHVGNFVELKKTRLGAGAKANHLAYLGDSVIGERANIGAGTITCNYDGQNKFPTEIGPDAFIGSNTALIAPVRVGAGSFVGAGSVITKDVPEHELGIARSRQKNLPLRKPAKKQDN